MWMHQLLNTRKWRIGIVDSADGLRHGGSCIAPGCPLVQAISGKAISGKPAPCIGGRAWRFSAPCRGPLEHLSESAPCAHESGVCQFSGLWRPTSLCWAVSFDKGTLVGCIDQAVPRNQQLARFLLLIPLWLPYATIP